MDTNMARICNDVPLAELATGVRSAGGIEYSGALCGQIYRHRLTTSCIGSIQV